MTDPVRTNATGDVQSYDGVLEAVRVATWPDEVSLWRTGLTRVSSNWRQSTFRIRSERVKNPTYQDERFWSKGVEYSVMIPTMVHRMVGGVHVHDAQVDAHLRWALPALGIMEAGRTPLVFRPGPSADDPWVGRFRAQTFEEALGDAAEADRRLSRLLADAPKTARGEISAGTADISGPLFAWPTAARVQWAPGKICYCVSSFLTSPSEGVNWTGLSPPQRRMSSFVDEMQYLCNSLSDARPRSWMVLPGEDHDRWWAEHTSVGRLALPEDEVEMYSLLGESLPFVWDDDRLRQWVLDRWGLP